MSKDRKPIEAKNDKVKYGYDKILGMMDGFNAPDSMPRFTRAEYTTELEKNLREFKNMHKEDIIRVRTLNEMNRKLEKNLKIAVDALEIVAEETGHREVVLVLKQLEGDQNEV